MKQFNLKETVNKINEVFKSKEFSDVYYMRSKDENKKEHWTKRFDELWETLDGIDGAYDYRDEIKIFIWKLIKSDEWE